MDKFVQIYENIMSLKDPRVDNWLFTSNPFIPLSIVLVYGIVLYVGKKYMATRQAFELKTFMLIYNLLQVIGSFYIFYEILVTAVLSRYSLVCQPVDYSNKPLALRMANALWMYYITKIIDLIDTIIFVLRKKDNQITFLHLFHHISMVCNGWSGVRFVAGGQTFLLALLNSFVHTIMYGYYGLAGLGPSVQKYLWWKKYLTQMQLIQFGIVLLHSVVNVFAECSYPKGYDYAFIIYGVFLTSLFLNFYRKSYDEKSKAKKSNKNGTSSSSSNGFHKAE